MKRASRVGLALLLFSICGAVIAQTTPDAVPVAGQQVDDRLRLAISSAEYPVTPGDVYQLTFLQGVESVTTQLIVESDYSVYLGVFGEINARGLRFAELKPRIEQIVADAYPRGFPSLNISSVGVFQVALTGAIPQSRRVSVWGLSRLSELVEDTVGPYTSLRSVVVVSATGRRSTYDIFRAIAQGDSANDPLLRPGDTVVFAARGLVVSVQGEVYEPGSYELLEGEGLEELERFFQGFTSGAETGRLVVQRHSGDTVLQIPLGSSEDARGFSFSDGDTLVVPRATVPQPVVYVEGAVGYTPPTGDADEGSSAPTYNRVSLPITAGDTLYSVLLDIQDQVSPYAEMERGYVIRPGVEDPIRINLREVVYRDSAYNDFELEPFDRIVIPVDQPSVIVSGDVANPGRFDYSPFESYVYYLSLAGIGSESLQDMRTVVRIHDEGGAQLPIDSEIKPGYTVHVPTREDRFVVVSGDIPDPGAYVYEPSRNFSYYVRLAGMGANAFASVRSSVEIYDENGDLVSRDAPIQPDYTVHVPPTEQELTPEGAFVLVTGAVNDPGLYELFGERGASYYILQAGGVNTEISADGTYEIRSSQGTPRPHDSIIQPGDTIDVNRNGFVYNFNRYFPVITSGLTFITTIIAIVNALNQ